MYVASKKPNTIADLKRRAESTVSISSYFLLSLCTFQLMLELGVDLLKRLKTVGGSRIGTSGWIRYKAPTGVRASDGKERRQLGGGMNGVVVGKLSKRQEC